jgi:yecA family protein
LRKLSSSAVEWDEARAEALRAALEARDAIRYPALAGFLFAVACSPELVPPSEWIARAFDEKDIAAASFDEAQGLVHLTMDLYNRINLEVLERKPSLPAGIEVRADPMENFGPDAPLGLWAAGFGAGQLWLEQTWEDWLRDEPDRRTLDETVSGLQGVLAFFATRELAEKWSPKMPGEPTLEQAAQRVLSALPEAMAALADIGRGLEEARRERARTPARRVRVGRNDPCPCGSGRKYKHCCGKS